VRKLTASEKSSYVRLHMQVRKECYTKYQEQGLEQAMLDLFLFMRSSPDERLLNT
jgi:hypothetical protein